MKKVLNCNINNPGRTPAQELRKKGRNGALCMLICIAMLAGIACSFAGCAKNSNASSFEFKKRTYDVSTAASEGKYDYSVCDDGTVIIEKYNGTESVLTIPETLGGKTVSEIGASAFSDNADLKNLTIGDNIEVIGDFAFFNCPGLEKINIGKGLYSIGYEAFNGTPWNDGLKDEFVIIGDGLLIKYNGNAKSLRIPGNVKHIGPAFVENNTIIEVIVGDNVLSIGNSAFLLCENLRRVSLGKNVTAIDDYAFNTCPLLTDINIPDKVKYIGNFSFSYSSSLASVHIGKNVEYIGTGAFGYSKSIAYVFLPKSVKTLGDSAFDYCYSIAFMFYEGTKEEYEALGVNGTNHYLNDAEHIYEYKDPRFGG